VIPAPTRYARASDVEHALELLAEPDAKALAGGQSLLAVMKLRIARPSLVVDISRLELRGVEVAGAEVRLGPLTTWDELVADPELRRPALAAIGECAAGIGDLQVRNRGTLGGSLAHADPASDMPAVLLALDSVLELRSPAGNRSLPLADLFLGPFTTALGTQELITGIGVPLPAAGTGSAYVSVEHPASGFALAGAAAVVRADGTRTVALTGVGAHPMLLPPTDDPLDALEAVEILGDGIAPAEYRRNLAATVVRRALGRAAQRSAESAETDR
jgi:carbon-monoxide dehydrogenase medium subunit